MAELKEVKKQMQNEENKYIFSFRVFREQENKRNTGRWSQKTANTALAEPAELLVKPEKKALGYRKGALVLIGTVWSSAKDAVLRI